MRKTDNMKKYTNIFTIAGLAGMIFLAGCVEKYDSDPEYTAIEYGTIVNISQVKALYDDELLLDWDERTPVQITEDWAITGIVTGSDKVDGNLYKEGYIEDASAGILLKFVATGGFYLGDSVIINLQDLYVGDYGDFVQIGDVPYTDDDGDLRLSGFNKDRRMIKVSVDNPSHPTATTITGLQNEDFLGRLVSLENVQFSSDELSSTYADAETPASENHDLEDCDGNTVIVRSSGYASFADELLPTGSGSFIGLVSIYDGDYQLVIRDISEVQLSGDRCYDVIGELGTPVESLSEDFESYTNGNNLNIDGWQNVLEIGDRAWQAKTYSSNTYAQATGYNSNLTEMVTWLITRPVYISSQKILTFQSAMAYWAHEDGNEPFELLFSTDYDGTNLSTATWTSLTANLADENDSDYAWVSSGNVYLPVESGASGVIAFKYTGSKTESTSYIIDDVEVSAAR